MAVTIDTKLSVPHIAVIALCETWAEAMAMTRAMEAVQPEAFAPAIAYVDGFPVTGGGASSQELLHGLTAESQRLGLYDAPPLSPAVEAMIERAEDADQATDDLKAGEAYREHAP